MSVVVPTCHRAQALDRCLTALVDAVGRCSSVCWEIVVSDDDRGGSARAVVAQYPDCVIWNQGPSRGPAANRNSGARRSKGQLLVFLDDDCIASPELLSAYAEAAANNPRVDVFEGRIVADRAMRYAYESCPVNLNGGYLWSANIAVRRACFEALGGFDEDFPFAAMEDIEFHHRCKKAGKQILFCPRACVVHPVEKRTGVSRLRKGQYAVLLYAEKHPDQLKRLLRSYSLRRLLRRVKNAIFQGPLVQPLDAYYSLAAELYSDFQLFRILRDPPSISSKRKELGREVLDYGDPRRAARSGD